MRSRSARRTRLSSTDRSCKMSSFNAARRGSRSRKIFFASFSSAQRSATADHSVTATAQPSPRAMRSTSCPAVALPTSSRAVRSLITRPGNRPHGRLPSTTVASDRAHGFPRRSAAGCAGRPDGSSCRSTHRRMQSSFDLQGSVGRREAPSDAAGD